MSVQDPQSDQPAHPNVVAAAVVGGAPVVTIAASVVASAKKIKIS